MTEDSVLETLRRVPDRIILAVAARDLEFFDNSRCLCGWVVREAIAEIRNMRASRTKLPQLEGDRYFTVNADDECAKRFGGTWYEWHEIYIGVTRYDDLPIIESAYVRRLDEACGFKEGS